MRLVELSRERRGLLLTIVDSSSVSPDLHFWARWMLMIAIIIACLLWM